MTSDLPLYWLSSPLSQRLVLRFWGEGAGTGRWVWRASVTDLDTGEKRSFSRPADLEAYVRGLWVGWAGDHSSPPASDDSTRF